MHDLSDAQLMSRVAAGDSPASTLLDRAMRAKCLGIVFADAAANGEVDPLTSVDARLFVGL